MRCPFCGNSDTSVKDSRNTDDNASIRRRRVCEACGSRFTTFERIQLRDLFVMKRSGQRVPFDRDKLTKSIMSATHKRSLDPERIDLLITGIIRQLETSGESEMPTKTIGEMAMKSLAYLDPVAYVRFASVYHDFTSIQDFMSLITKMDQQFIQMSEQHHEV